MASLMLTAPTRPRFGTQSNGSFNLANKYHLYGSGISWSSSSKVICSMGPLQPYKEGIIALISQMKELRFKEST